MLPGCDPTGGRTAAAMILTTLALIPVGLLSVAVGLGGYLVGVGSALLALMFVRKAVVFARSRTDRDARGVLKASLLYLPGVFLLLLIDNLAAR
jgi:protoheme IX farnesyltransferase